MSEKKENNEKVESLKMPTITKDDMLMIFIGGNSTTAKFKLFLMYKDAEENIMTHSYIQDNNYIPDIEITKWNTSLEDTIRDFKWQKWMLCGTITNEVIKYLNKYNIFEKLGITK